VVGGREGGGGVAQEQKGPPPPRPPMTPGHTQGREIKAGNLVPKIKGGSHEKGHLVTLP
jgi:hypothetical protein